MGMGNVGTKLLLAALVWSGCKDDRVFPIEPVISFQSYELFDDNGTQMVRIALNFTDGNGDVGLASGDTFPPFNSESPYYYNLWIKYFENKEGVFEEVVLPAPLSGRIPVLNNTGRDRPLQGEIFYEIDISLRGSDTLKMEFQLVDRDLNQSNVADSGPMVIL
jgi:hypothetical protein